MPIDVFAEFQKYVIQDSGIGSNMDDVTNHYATLYKYLANGMSGEAATECYNLYQNIFLMLSKISIESICFACFVHSIDEKETLDYSEANLRETAKRLAKAGVTQGHVSDILEDLKKKLMPS